MKLTMGQAAKHLDTSKATLSRAIKEGRLSAERREDGSYAIDPAELQRYADASEHRFHRQTGQQNSSPTHQTTLNETPETPAETAGYAPILEAKLEGLKALLAEKERRIADLETDRDQLQEDRKLMGAERDRLLKVIEEQAGTVRLLTAPRPEPAQTPANSSRSLMERLFGVGRAKTPSAA